MANVFQTVSSAAELEGYSALSAADKKTIGDRGARDPGRARLASHTFPVAPPAEGAEVKTPAKKQRSPSPAPASKSKKAKK